MIKDATTLVKMHMCLVMSKQPAEPIHSAKPTEPEPSIAQSDYSGGQRRVLTFQNWFRQVGGKYFLPKPEPPDLTRL